MGSGERKINVTLCAFLLLLKFLFQTVHHLTISALFLGFSSPVKHGSLWGSDPKCPQYKEAHPQALTDIEETGFQSSYMLFPCFSWVSGLWSETGALQGFVSLSVRTLSSQGLYRGNVMWEPVIVVLREPRCQSQAEMKQEVSVYPRFERCGLVEGGPWRGSVR